VWPEGPLLKGPGQPTRAGALSPPENFLGERVRSADAKIFPCWCTPARRALTGPVSAAPRIPIVLFIRSRAAPTPVEHRHAVRLNSRATSPPTPNSLHPDRQAVGQLAVAHQHPTPHQRSWSTGPHVVTVTAWEDLARTRRRPAQGDTVSSRPARPLHLAFINQGPRTGHSRSPGNIALSMRFKGHRGARRQGQGHTTRGRLDPRRSRTRPAADRPSPLRGRSTPGPPRPLRTVQIRNPERTDMNVHVASRAVSPSHRNRHTRTAAEYVHSRSCTAPYRDTRKWIAPKAMSRITAGHSRPVRNSTR